MFVDLEGYTGVDVNLERNNVNHVFKKGKGGYLLVQGKEEDPKSTIKDIDSIYERIMSYQGALFYCYACSSFSLGYSPEFINNGPTFTIISSEKSLIELVNHPYDDLNVDLYNISSA